MSTSFPHCKINVIIRNLDNIGLIGHPSKVGCAQIHRRCTGILRIQWSVVSAQNFDAPCNTTKLCLNEEPRMDADQHGLKRNEETRRSRFSETGSQNISVSIRVHPWFKSNGAVRLRKPLMHTTKLECCCVEARCQSNCGDMPGTCDSLYVKNQS